MKKILTILFCIIFYTGFSQTLTPPNTPGFTSRSTLPVEDKIMSARQHFNLPRYTDTLQANTYGLIDSCGAMIFSYDVMSVWYRSCYNGGKKWVQLMPSGSPTADTFYWRTTGNAQGSNINFLGTTDLYNLRIGTNNNVRVILPAAGLTFNQLVTDTTANKVMTFNPVSKEWGYGYWYGGGSSSTPTLQQVLATQGNLAEITSSTDIYASSPTQELLFGDNGVWSTIQMLAKNSSEMSAETSPEVGSKLTVGYDSLILKPYLGRLRIDTLTNVAARYVLHYNPTTGLVSYADTTAVTSAIPISSLTAATGSNSINNGDFEQNWQWSTLSAAGLSLASGSSAASGNSQILFSASLSNANSNSNQTTKVASFDNSHSGTGSTNIALQLSASGGTNNIGLNIAAGSLSLNGSAGTSGQVLTSAGSNTLPTWTTPTAGANTALSNLASVAVNTSILPGTTNTIALGSTAKIWSDVQADYFHTGGLNANYGGYSGAILGGVSNGAVLDFFHANTRIGEFYTLSSSFNFFTGTGKALNFYTNNSTSIPLLTGSGTSAQLGVNMTTPTAQFHISAGSTAAGSSPIKFTAGTNMTAAEAGAMEWDGTNLFITQTTGPTRKTIAYTTDLTGLPYWALTGTSSLTGASTIDMAGFDLTINNSAANDEVFLVAVNPGLVEFKLVADTKKAYLLSGAIAAGSDGDALTIVDHTTGEIGSAPNLAFNLRKEGTMIYAKNGRVYAEDNSGNQTLISPHDKKGNWIYESYSTKTGVTTKIDMIKLATVLEKVSGEKLIYKTKKKK